jgi:hypothetical protein
MTRWKSKVKVSSKQHGFFNLTALPAGARNIRWDSEIRIPQRPMFSLNWRLSDLCLAGIGRELARPRLVY